MPTPLDDKVSALITAFIANLNELVRRSAMATVTAALGLTRSVAASRARQPSAGSRAGVVRVREVGKGQKRDPDAIAALEHKLAAHIRKNPGLRIEEIGKAMGTPTKELKLPAKKLIEAKKLTTKGVKRATTYYAR